MVSELNAESTLAEWVLSCPAIARIMEGQRLDYCCGGQRSLSQACQDVGADISTVLAQLIEAAEAPDDSSDRDADWTSRTLADLCGHIKTTHHAYLRNELPRLAQLIDKVVSAHSPQHPELQSLPSVFRALQEELYPHMMKEEQILFPAICRLESSPQAPAFPFGSVNNPIRMMEHEHSVAGSALAQLRSLTNDYQAPDEACNSWKVLLEGLRELEADLHVHIHKENNILFPAAARLEAERN